MAITPTVEQYADAMFKISPSGFIIPNISDDSNYGTLLEVIAKATYDAQLDADTQLNEIFPDVAGAHLSDWERILELPKCANLDDLSAQQRRDIVLAWLNISEFNNEEFLINIAAIIGYTITIDYPDSSFGPDYLFHFTVNAAAQTPVYFRVGSSAVGDRLISYGNEALECLINYFKPAHAIATFNYT